MTTMNDDDQDEDYDDEGDMDNNYEISLKSKLSLIA